MDLKTEERDVSAQVVWILYGSHTGNAERLAGFTHKRLVSAGLDVVRRDMFLFDPIQLTEIRRLVIIVSTHGIGEPPVAAAELHEFVMAEQDMNLGHLGFAVLALGDTEYAQFCQTGKDFDESLARLRAKRLLERVDLDLDFEEGFLAWLAELERCIGNDRMIE